MPNAIPTLTPRLAAEFVVIVIGVLVALAVDGWAQHRADRALEREYVQRLLDDVRYDMQEFAFLDAIGSIGLDASVALSSPQEVADLDPSVLVSTVIAVSNERQPDLSRSTYRELLASGRLDLIQASEVRVLLAAYDRRILETEAIWVNLSPRLRAWTLSRIPGTVWVRYDEACSPNAEDAAFKVREMICEFDLGGWSAEALRHDVLSPDGRERITLGWHRFRNGLSATETLQSLAAELAAALERSLSGS